MRPSVGAAPSRCLATSCTMPSSLASAAMRSPAPRFAPPAGAAGPARRPPAALRHPHPARRTARRPAPTPPRAASFDSLAAGLSKAWDAVRKDGKLTADNVKAPLREIRRALLEADVSLPVVRQFVARVEAAALGVAVTKGITPDQQLVKVVYDELKALMGGERAGLAVPDAGPQVILMAGLQGVGKTTAAAKLAKRLQEADGKRVLLVACDVYRPAAIEQLQALGKRIGVPVFTQGRDVPPPSIAAAGVAEAAKEGYDAIIVDTAGRLQIDEAMMAELRDVAAAVRPTDTLLVVDAMTGQEAATLAAAFGAAAPLTGAVLTKMDGDARGGAALSVRAVSGAPIKFVGAGEGLDALEPFYPDRLAGRILGMGDVLTLVEKAETAVKEEDAAAMTARMMSAKFDFNDFLGQYKAISGMGGMASVLKMLPGMSGVSDKQLSAAEKQFKVFESMINSMTVAERQNPDLLARTPSRRRRVARGSGRTEADVAGLMATFVGMRSRMRGLAAMMRGAAGGVPGMPALSDEELLAQTVATSAAGVSPGKVRRRKPKGPRGSRGGLAELATLRQ